MASTTSITSTGTSRVVALVDMDCFYVQVEERDHPEIKGRPAAVVQYNNFKGGAIIAVNYEARAKGVQQGGHRGDDAKAMCPDIIMVQVPETRGKADLTKYRDAGKEVIQVLSEFSDSVERASIDEAYIDLTTAVEKRMDEIENNEKDESSPDLFADREHNVLKRLDRKSFETNFVMGYESTEEWFGTLADSEMVSLDDLRLTVGAEIVGRMREAVFQKTGFRCSAGIAHNKVLAKLCAGLNKPNKQTIMPHSSIDKLWAETSVKKVRNLGGKLGSYLVEQLKCEKMVDLLKFSEKELCRQLGAKAGSWIFQLARGFDDELVNPRQLPKSVGCNKNFLGPEALTTKDKVKHWLTQLSEEVTERLQKDYNENKRRARTLTLHVTFEEQNGMSKSFRINPQYNPERILADVWCMMEKLYKTVGLLPINMLGLIASRFEDETILPNCSKISDFFAEHGANNPSTSRASTSTATTLTSAADSSNRMQVDYEDDTDEDEDVPAPAIPSTSTSENAKPPIFDSNLFNNILKKKSPMKHHEEPVPNLPGLSPSKIPYTQECERCGKYVHVTQYVEHMDHHTARDLYREVNSLPPLGFDLRPETREKQERERLKLEKQQRILKSPGKKRGVKRNKPGGVSSAKGKASPKKKAPQPPPARPIDTYFVKKS